VTFLITIGLHDKGKIEPFGYCHFMFQEHPVTRIPAKNVVITQDRHNGSWNWRISSGQQRSAAYVFFQDDSVNCVYSTFFRLYFDTKE
jgi:hypothetical protein